MFVKLVTDKYSTQVVSVQLTWAWFVTGVGFVVNKITTITRKTFKGFSQYFEILSHIEVMNSIFICLYDIEWFGEVYAL